MKNFRDNGAVGALLDEYEKAVLELQQLLTEVSQSELVTIVDKETKDNDCRSIQTILTHVVRAGNCYVIAVRKHLGENLDFVERKLLNSIPEYQKALETMFQYNVQLFADYPNLEIENYQSDEKILTTWGQRYDVEQLMEHAIVHILRHRRQIERFLIRLRKL